MRVSRKLVLAITTLAVIGSLGGMVVFLASREGRLGQFLRALSLPAAFAVLLIAVLATPLVLAALIRANRRRSQEEEVIPARVPEEVARAAEEQARRAEVFVERVVDVQKREELSHELSQIEAEGRREVSSLHVVVFGTGSAGKTSLINALIGRHVGETEAVMGTTRHGESHTYELKGGRRDRPVDRHAGTIRGREAGGSRARSRPAAWPFAPTCSCSWSIMT